MAGSASPRNATLRNNIVASFLVKGLALVVSFASTPAYIAFFDDNSVLGIWFAVLSMLNWVLFFDFGLGNGLRNQLVNAWAKGDIAKSRELISSGYAALGIAILSLVLVCATVLPMTNWNSVFSISEDAIGRKELLLCIGIVVFGTLIQLWLRLITSVLYAFEKTALPSMVTLVSNAAMLVVVLFPLPMGVYEKLLYVSCAQVLSMNLPLFAVTVWFFLFKYPQIMPKVGSITKASAKSVTCLGGQFFAIQLCLMIISSSNEILIAVNSSSAEVVEYSVYYRLFNLAVTMFSLVVQPLWSSMGRAVASGQGQWVAILHGRFLLSAIMASGTCFVVIPLLPTVFSFWLGPESSVIPDATVAASFACLSSCMLILNASTCVANATGKLSVQLLGLGLGALAKIPLSMLFSCLGWVGIVWANVACLIPAVLAQTVASKKIASQYAHERAD